MQLPRVIIAAVFFVIGALILVQTLTRDGSSSDASESPTPANGSTPLATDSPSESPSGTRTASRSPSPTRTATRTPTKTPSPTRPPAAPTTSPAQPLLVTIGSVHCPGREVSVTVRNTSTGTQDYTVETNDGTAPKGDRLNAGQSRTTEVTLREDRRTRITVTWRNEPVRQSTRTANCRTRSPVAEPNPSPSDELPHTGADSALWARATTGIAAMITGIVIFWYGGIWPRRKDKIFPNKRHSA